MSKKLAVGPRSTWPLAGLILLCCGCEGEDAARLGRLGRKAAAKIQAMTTDANAKLANGFQAVRVGAAEPSLEARVSQRLQWDKALAESKIEVACQGGTVELKGFVADANQRRRAGELAESTSGVDKVANSLEVAVRKPEPARDNEKSADDGDGDK